MNHQLLFQPVGNDWQPFLPGLIIPEMSLLINDLFVPPVPQLQPPWAKVSFDPN